MQPSNPVTDRTQSGPAATTLSLQDAALELAEAGWDVHPLRGKRTASAHGFKDATRDPARIRLWFGRGSNLNIGIAVPPGIVVVDVDRIAGGFDTLHAIEAEWGPLPPTLTSETGGYGLHLLYACDTRGLSQKVIGPGIQSRVGGRGYIVAPPSIHPDTGRAYAWRQPASPVAPAPRFLVELLRDHPLPSSRIYPRSAAPCAGGRDFSSWTGEEILEWAAARVARAQEGERHDKLLRTAILMAGHVTAGRVTEDQVERTLLEVADRWSNHYRDRQTIRDGLAYGRGLRAIG